MSETVEATAFDHMLDLIRSLPDQKHFRQGPKEADERFIDRIVSLFSADDKQGKPLISEEDFDSLPQDARDWYNESARAKEAEQPVSPPPGFVSKFSAGKPAATKAAKAEKPAKAAKAEKPAKVAKEKVVKEKAPRENSKTYVLRLALAESPQMDLGAFMRIAEANGVGESTAKTVRSDTLATLRAAKETGRYAG